MPTSDASQLSSAALPVQILMTGSDTSAPLLDDAPVCAMRPRGPKTLPDRQSVAASIATLILTLPALCE